MKRFTETTKWADPWFRKLSERTKLLWSYLTDNCNQIGLIDLDLEAASFHIGGKIEEKHLAELGDRVQRLVNGKIFIPKFIPFQYGHLTESCPAHRPILKLVSIHQLTPNPLGYAYPITRVAVTIPMVIGKGKEKEKDQEEERKGSKFSKPTIEEIKDHCASLGLQPSDADWFFHKCEGNGWLNKGAPIRSWKSTISSWKAAGYIPSQKAAPGTPGGKPKLSVIERDLDRMVR